MGTTQPTGPAAEALSSPCGTPDPFSSLGSSTNSPWVLRPPLSLRTPPDLIGSPSWTLEHACAPLPQVQTSSPRACILDDFLVLRRRPCEWNSRQCIAGAVSDKPAA